MDAQYNPLDVTVKSNKDGTYSCSYVPKKGAKHTVQVRNSCLYSGHLLVNFLYFFLLRLYVLHVLAGHLRWSANER